MARSSRWPSSRPARPRRSTRRRPPPRHRRRQQPLRRRPLARWPRRRPAVRWRRRLRRPAKRRRSKSKHASRRRRLRAPLSFGTMPPAPPTRGACAETVPLPPPHVDIFVQQLVNGLTLGSVYAIVALGYTMVYGIIQLINFAHGEVVMIGAMVALTVITTLLGAHVALPAVVIVILGTLCAIPVCMAVGFTLERVAYRPLRRAPRLAPLITAIGLSIVLQHLAMIIWSRNPLAFPQIVNVVSYHMTDNPNGATITNVQIAIIVTSLLMMAGLLGLVYRTKLGI